LKNTKPKQSNLFLCVTKAERPSPPYFITARHNCSHPNPI